MLMYLGNKKNTKGGSCWEDTRYYIFQLSRHRAPKKLICKMFDHNRHLEYSHLHIYIIHPSTFILMLQSVLQNRHFTWAIPMQHQGNMLVSFLPAHVFKDFPLIVIWMSLKEQWCGTTLIQSHLIYSQMSLRHMDQKHNTPSSCQCSESHQFLNLWDVHLITHPASIFAYLIRTEN